MVELRLTIPDHVAARFNKVAQQLNVPLEEVVSVALAMLDESDETLDEDTSDDNALAGIRAGMKDALSGNTVSAKEALEQIEREATIEEALQQE